MVLKSSAVIRNAGAIFDARMLEYDDMCLMEESATTSETEKPATVKLHISRLE